MNHRDDGFSLIELLIAMTIGLILLGGVFAIYIETQATRRTADTMAQLHSVGQLVTSRLAQEISLAGYWGLTTHEPVIEGSGTVITGVNIGNECVTPVWALQLDTEIEAHNSDDTAFDSTCLKDQGRVTSADFLVVRGADPIDENFANGVSASDAGKLFVRSSESYGVIFEGGANPPTSGFNTSDPDSYTDHRINVSLYYVRDHTSRNEDGSPADSVPSLRQFTLADNGTDPAMKNSFLVASGVEDLQVQLGLLDGVGTNAGPVIRYVNPGSAEIATGAANVVAVRLWLLLRAEREENGYINSDTYHYADRSFTPNDGFRRLLLSRTILTRNMAEIL